MRRREDLGGARGAILDAAIAVIRAEGIEAATVREIAGRAGVNIALINYYYSSKDALVDEALASLFGELAQRLETRPSPSGGEEGTRPRGGFATDSGREDPKAALRAFVLAWWDFIDLNAALFKAIVARMMAVGRPPEALRDFVGGPGLAGLRGLLEAARGGPVSKAEALQFLSALLMPRVLGKAFGELSGLDLAAKESLEAYLDSLIANFT